VYIALAQYYTDVNRGSQAIKALQTGSVELPRRETVLTFELGAVYDKQKRHCRCGSRVPPGDRARPATCGGAQLALGYMLAERGERLDESIDLVRRALVIEPDNGSYLDSLGWAYYKSNKLELALDNLKKAATNSRAIRDSGSYGDVLFKLGRFRRRDCRLGSCAHAATAIQSIAATSTRRFAPPARSSRRNDASGAVRGAAPAPLCLRGRCSCAVAVARPRADAPDDAAAGLAGDSAAPMRVRRMTKPSRRAGRSQTSAGGWRSRDRLAAGGFAPGCSPASPPGLRSGSKRSPAVSRSSSSWRAAATRRS
jgi:hypothetical protein